MNEIFGGPVQMSEVKLASHLNLSRVVHRRAYFAEGGYVSKAGSWVGKVGMIEGIEELKTKFDLTYLS